PRGGGRMKDRVMKGNELQVRGVSGDLGGTMRLGAYPAILQRGSRGAQIYHGATEISERHRHRYEVNTHYKGRLEQHGMHFSGMSPDGLLPEMIEYEDHPDRKSTRLNSSYT